MFYKSNTLTLFLLIAASANTDIAQSELIRDTTRIGTSLMKEAASSISSRFHKLGGVIGQLFSGFNQGTPRGITGPNIPPNSYFYPGVTAPSFHWQPLSGTGNKWSNLNQGIIQGNNFGGIQNQQLNEVQPGFLNYNSVAVLNEGQPKQAQDLAQFLNTPNNNGPQTDLYGDGPEGNTRTQRSAFNFPQSSEESGFTGDQSGGLGKGNEGTLDDFFTTTERTLSTRPAIRGQAVVIPTTTQSNDRIVFEDDSETPFQRQCVQNCPTTTEYSPVCGSDGVTYFNPGRLVCARNCGINVRFRRRGSCASKGR